MARGPAPTVMVEKGLWEQGHRVVVGMDEVGRGAWAGPVSVGAAVVPVDRTIEGVRDSKLLREPERERLFPLLAKWCIGWAVGHATPQECDALGMTGAQRLAGQRALEDLGLEPDWILLDGRVDFIGGGKTQTIVKGDQTCLSIAAASVLAKVTRDRIMRDVAVQFPEFFFADNKGYPSQVHRNALATYGPTEIHRRSWAFMDKLNGYERIQRPTLFDDDDTLKQ